VERAYLEPSGKISAFKQPQESVRPGLPVLPEGVEGRLRTHRCGETVLIGAAYACWECGHTVDLLSGKPFPECAACQGRQWARAVISVHEALGLVARAE
jgi:DNA-directed RNA polymerase subunit RPC12/RpoP